MYSRTILEQIKHHLFRKKIIILYGPRQVGKTTLVKQILTQYPQSRYLSCDSPDVAEALHHKTAKQMKTFFGEATKLVILDEAQYIPNIGNALKLMVDTYPELQIIATGSSSFDLAHELQEPLTGRYIDFFLYPLAIAELKQHWNDWEIKHNLEKILLTGLYPEVWEAAPPENQQILHRIQESYLFKDILAFDKIRSSSKLKKLLQAVALQLGSEVSLQELANLIGIDKNTVEHYLTILQKAFILIEIPAFSRNLRKEIKKNKKIYFYDIGIRNSLIQNFAPLELRNDKGALWENFCIVETIKNNTYKKQLSNFYFWRTYDQQEIDLIEEKNGRLFTYEYKWNSKKAEKYNPPASFLEAYADYKPKSCVVTPDNFLFFFE